MNTLTNNLRAGVVGLAAAVVCVTTLPVRAEQVAPKPEPASKQQNAGVVTGLAIGAVAGGPVGAIFGAAAGAWLGDRYHKQAVTQTTLTASLQKTEGERTQLAGNVSELNGSLARAHDRGEQLTQIVTHTDQVETDVGFRTNDASVSEQSMSPLLKLGALAAAMPDAKVRISGYADPRGSDEVNDALSKRRAEAVAAVLATSGLPADRMMVEAHGKVDSTSAEGDLDGYAFDRRVTVRIERVASDSVASR